MCLVVVYRSQAPPVIAVQLGALGWMDAPAECEVWKTGEQRGGKKGIKVEEGNDRYALSSG